MSSSGQFSSQNNILLNNMSQCPSEAMSNYTVEDKISVLMSNQSQSRGNQFATPVTNENQDIYRKRRDSINSSQNMVEDNKIRMKKLNKLLKMSILDKTSKTQNKQDNSYRVKEHHFMKSLYLHKLNKLQNKESQEFTLIKSSKMKSASQSVSGTDDKSSSHKSSNLYQPMVARSVCGGMAEEKPLNKYKSINFSGFK